LSCSTKTNKNTVIGIQTYSGFSKSETDTISYIISRFYKVKTIVLPVKSIYSKAFTNIKSPRYRADSIIIIIIQKRDKPDSLDYIIGLTNKDISITKHINGKIKSPEWKYNDWGIMGLAYCPGNSAIVSSFRIKSSNYNLYFTRLKKVTIHELSHNLGLPHCPNKKCVMTDAVENIATIDHSNLALCKDCNSKI
jgi:archaemetzincin